MGDWEQILRDLSESDYRHGGFFKEALAEIALLRSNVKSLQTYVADALTVETLKATIAQQAERIRILEEEDTDCHRLKDSTICMLAEQLAAAEKDAERYRFLRQLDAKGIQVYHGEEDASIFGNELDAAIDEAMKGK